MLINFWFKQKDYLKMLCCETCWAHTEELSAILFYVLSAGDPMEPAIHFMALSSSINGSIDNLHHNIGLRTTPMLGIYFF